MGIIQYLSGDGYSRMFEPPDEEELQDEAKREWWELMLKFHRHPFGVPVMGDLVQMQERWGVEAFTTGMLRKALVECDRRAADAARRDANDRAKMAAGQRVQHHPWLVYYMLTGIMVKIGTSTNLTSRLATFRPERLLAVEPGGHDVERSRHHQFAQWRSHGEWFRASAELQEHVDRCRVEHADLFRPWANWKPGTHGRGRVSAT